MEKSRKQKIEDAYNLIKGINFDRVIQLLKEWQTPEFFKKYWPQNTPDIPDKNLIQEDYNNIKTAWEELINNCNFYADPDFVFEERLFIVAEEVLREKYYLNHLRIPSPDLLNVGPIGRLWAYADILLKYYPVYSNESLLDSMPVGFKTKLAEDKAGTLCDALKQAGFIDQNTEPEHLKAVLCGLPIKKRVQWVKLQPKNKRVLHKKSPIELIELLGMKTTYKDHREQFKQCFSDNTGAPMIINASTWYDNKSVADAHSAYYNELANIVERLNK